VSQREGARLNRGTGIWLFVWKPISRIANPSSPPPRDACASATIPKRFTTSA